MKTISIVIAVLLLSSCSVMDTKKEEVAQENKCKSEGGCITITKKQLTDLLRSTYEEGLYKNLEIRQDAYNTMCIRPS